MSAITGIFMRNGKDVDPELMKKMNNKLGHRGPDGSSTWCQGSVGLGHQMLWTTPESLHEKLPLEEDGLVITADARIDNRTELSEKLGIPDEEDVADSYFILKAYAKWREECPDKLLGDFAFAIWDKQEEKLFCARDHMGVKPFYYYLDDDMFVFGTEIKALFCVDGVPKEINELLIAFHLETIYHEREFTVYKNIFRLPAAYSLELRSNKHILDNYWELNPDIEINLKSDVEYEKKFLEIFDESVKCRLRNTTPYLGSMLSGGLDSSSVTCIAQRNLKQNGSSKLKTFSAVFDSVPESNERFFIEKVIFHAKLDHCFINADEISPLKDLENFFWHADNPFIQPNTFMIWNIYKRAHEIGIKVLLDGFDGDTTISHGKGFLKDLLKQGMIRKFFSEIRYKSKILKINPLKTILGVILDLIVPKILKVKFLNIRDYLKYKSKTKIIKKDFDNRLLLINEASKVYENDFGSESAHMYHYNDLKSSMIQYEMEFVDWMASACSIEPRHPFYDKRLVEFCLAIPSEQKFFEGWSRSIMRRAMEDILPFDVQWRKYKGDLSHNFDRNFLLEKKVLNENLTQNHEFLIEYVEIEKIKKIYEKCKKESDDDILFIWNALVINMWLKKMKTY